MQMFRLIVRTLLLSALLSLPAASAFAKRSLDLSVLSPELREEVLKRFPGIEKDNLHLDKIDEVLRYLQLRPEFDRLQVFEEDGNYKLRYEYAKRLGEVSFKGMKFFSESEITSLMNIKKGEVFDQNTLIEKGEKLRQGYKDVGFMNAVIDIEMPPGKDGAVDIVVKVTENKRTLITSIILQSPNAELNKDLSKKLKSVLDDPLTEKAFEIGRAHV